MDERKILFKDGEVAYFFEGNGPPVLFIHGFPMDHSIWNHFVGPLTASYRVILPDNPGFGKSTLPATEISIGVYADAIRALLDAEQIKSCVMIGHSMGGYITMNFAQRFSGYLRGIGLFHSATFEDDEPKKKDRIRVAEFVRRNGSAPFVNELIGKLFSDDYALKHPKEIDELKTRYSRFPPDSIAAASLAMGKRADTTPVLRRSNLPVLFITGQRDKIAPPEKVLQLAHLPQRSSIHLLPPSAHMGMKEAPEECLHAINGFLQACELFAISFSE